MTYYLARRYFNLSVQDWKDLPWWEGQLLMEGLENQKIIGGEQEKAPQPGQPKPSPTLDLTQARLDSIGGFSTRRAG